MTDAPPSNRAAILVIGAGLLFGLAAGLVVFFGLPALSQTPASGGAGDPVATAGPLAAPAPIVGAPAPDFVLTTLAGEQVHLADLKGQVVMINFWATWCGPCEAEMPAIQSRYDTLRTNGLVVLAVNADESAETVQPFVDRWALTFPILMDPGLVVNDLYRVRGMPTTFFIGRDGVIAAQKVGLMSEGQLDRYLGEVGLGGQ